MSYYRHHVFFCTNVREDGEQCCSQMNSVAVRNYAKRRCKELDIYGQGQTRINTAGCMNRCSEGPVMVIYPEGVWYTFIDEQDVEEIIQEHLIHGRIVERLRI